MQDVPLARQRGHLLAELLDGVGLGRRGRLLSRPGPPGLLLGGLDGALGRALLGLGVQGLRLRLVHPDGLLVHDGGELPGKDLLGLLGHDVPAFLGLVRLRANDRTSVTQEDCDPAGRENAHITSRSKAKSRTPVKAMIATMNTTTTRK